jgi:hypothetical protein
MPEYRLYLIDSDGGVSKPPITIECKGDDEALVRSRDYASHNTIEIWQSDRWVGETESAAVGTTKPPP